MFNNAQVFDNLGLRRKRQRKLKWLRKNKKKQMMKMNTKLMMVGFGDFCGIINIQEMGKTVAVS